MYLFLSKNNKIKEENIVKRQLRSIVVSAVALSMVVSAAAMPEAGAASTPKLSAKSVSVKVGKTKKVTVKGVKASKIKKTTWSIKSKKIATISAKKKNSVTVKGKKAGSTTLTAKIKVGKKTTKKTCKVKVSGSSAAKNTATNATPTPVTATATPVTTSGTTATATATAVATATPAPTLRPLDQSYKNAKAPAKLSADSMPTTPPSPDVDPATAMAYEEDFENIEVGTKVVAADYSAECPDGLHRISLRTTDAGSNADKDYVEVIDAKDVPESTHGSYKPRTGKVLLCHREQGGKDWQGPMINLTGILEPGATYRVKFSAYSKDCTTNFSEDVQATEFTDRTFAYMPGRMTESRWQGTKGIWKDFNFEITLPFDMYYYGFYLQSDDGAAGGDIYLDDISIVKTGAVKMDENIPSLKETYKDVFPVVAVGTGADTLFGTIGDKFIQNQYNAITPGNEFKPESIMGKKEMTEVTIEDAKAKGYFIPEGYESDPDNQNKDGVAVVPELDFEMVDKIIETCHKENLKLRGHTLVWHAQMPTYFFQKTWRTTTSKKYNTTRENMDRRLEFFVKSTLDHVLKKDAELSGGDKSKNVLYAYDVVNEYLHSKGANGTFFHTIYNTTADNLASTGVTLRPSFVKDSFTWAREVLKANDRLDVKLFYNDFNSYDIPEDIVHLVDFINEDGIVCDGVGMQSHLAVDNPTADLYAQCLECFRVNLPGMEVQVTELDAGLNGKTDQEQGAYYDQIMGAILQNKKAGGNITGIVIWGTHDGTSWRADSKPCLCSGLFAPKSAFFSVIDAKARYWK